MTDSRLDPPDDEPMYCLTHCCNWDDCREDGQVCELIPMQQQAQDDAADAMYDMEGDR